MPPSDTAPSLSSRERMIAATVDLLRGHGLTGAGINDIVRESAAPKGSVYHFFPGGKLQIAEEALRAYVPQAEAFIEKAMAGPRTPALRVKALFEAFARRVEDAEFRRSCPIGTVSLDLDGEAEPLRPVLQDALATWTRAIERHIDLGDPRRSRAFAGLAMTAIEGAYVRARAEHSAQAFREAGRWLAQAVG
jgi:TetR/AcrR family transcriptional repressor of lmrAB and yxaGH operons